MLLNKIILKLFEIAALSQVTRSTKRGVPVDHEPGWIQPWDCVTGQVLQI